MSISNINTPDADIQLKQQLSLKDQKATSTPHELTPEEQKQVKELKRRDREVRQHEQAHKAAAGQFAQGGPSFEYEIGPDGRRYAVGGSVAIDTSKVQNDPEATIRKAQQVKRAALAPKDPSSQDRKVAAEASRLEAEARKELVEQKKEETKLYDREGQTAFTVSKPSVLDLVI